MILRRRDLMAEDLAEAIHSAVDGVRSAVDGAEAPTPADTLAALEEERRLLSERHRRLRESIDLLERTDRLQPDAAARLRQYKTAQQEIVFREMQLELLLAHPNPEEIHRIARGESPGSSTETRTA